VEAKDKLMEEYCKHFYTWSDSQILLSQSYNILVHLFSRLLEY